MASNLRISTKRLQIDKANSTIVIAVSVAAFVTAFSLVAARSLIARQSYQNKVITAREEARDQLQENINAIDDLKIKYTEFVNRQENMIKGSSNGNGERDGDNARIVLDALPSKYDFPALVSSLEKILAERNYKIETIGGTDNEASIGDNVANTDTQVDPSAVSGAAPVVSSAVDMPFEVSASGTYKGIIELLGVFKNSIRPLYVQTFSISAGDANNVQLTVQGKSYYQPERTLNITEEVVQ